MMAEQKPAGKARTPEGWGWPRNSRKAHYFCGRRSLCGRWAYTGPLEQGNDQHPDNCRACVKAKGKRDD